MLKENTIYVTRDDTLVEILRQTGAGFYEGRRLGEVTIYGWFYDGKFGDGNGTHAADIVRKASAADIYNNYGAASSVPLVPIMYPPRYSTKPDLLTDTPVPGTKVATDSGIQLEPHTTYIHESGADLRVLSIEGVKVMYKLNGETKEDYYGAISARIVRRKGDLPTTGTNCPYEDFRTKYSTDY